ncbi:hypothetical protein QCA50_007960 [Cerrena zonata]|uniref:Uncharacterized protein n=1 Tax=Cerrena zonata TaxID=2478898 RepID=A0AAW0GD41_9APHY
MTKLYLPGAASTEHALKRDYLLAILAPITKSTTCLELSLLMVSDVFVFFLAVMCEIHDFITAPSSVPIDAKERIRCSANHRYKCIIDSSDIYLTGFILNPCYWGSSILKDYSPLAIKAVKLSLQKGSSGRRDKQKQVNPQIFPKFSSGLASFSCVLCGSNMNTKNDQSPIFLFTKLSRDSSNGFVSGSSRVIYLTDHMDLPTPYKPIGSISWTLVKMHNH